MERRSVVLVALIVCVASNAPGQMSGGKLPEALRPSLLERLEQYTDAQADGQWDVVASLLGPHRGAGHSAVPYSPEHKSCLIDQMKIFPMTSFELKSEMFSTEILSTPPSRKWWFLIGDAVFKNNGTEQKAQTSFIAYRENGRWYFTPPNFDDSWVKSHLTDADRSADYADEIVIHITPKCPLEIDDLHARLDKTYPSIRNLTFKLKNVSDKQVRGYTLRLYIKGGDVIYGAGYTIDPGDSRDEKMDSTRYSYFCEGIRKDNLIVDEVNFADGSEWKLPKPRKTTAKGN
jgi:hypothetical protein